MQSMRKTIYTGSLALVGLLAMTLLSSCSANTAFSSYSRYMFEGHKYWKVREYEPARRAFLSAYEAKKEVTALSWAATVSYQLGDLAGAERYIREAEIMPMLKASVSWFRVMGYKALILFKQEKKAEGFALLKEYLYAYGRTYPSTNQPLIELMVRKGEVDLARLQAMLEEDIYAYEEEMGLFTSAAVGYYDRNSGAATGNTP